LENATKFTDKGEIRLYVTWEEDSESFEDLLKPNPIYTKRLPQVSYPDPKDFKSFLEENGLSDNDVEPEYSFVSQSFLRHNHELIVGSNRNVREYYIFNEEQVNIQDKLSSHYRKVELAREIQSQTEGKLKIEIIDTGCGIHQKTQSKLFALFAQEDASVTRKYGGSGLGLFIIKKLIEKMNGDIQMHSKKNFGSDFIVTLPCSIDKNSIKNDANIVSNKIRSPKFASAPLIDDKESKSINYERGIKALIVDDDKCNLLVMSKYMDKLGIASATASDGDEAYSLYVSKGIGYFSFITMDIQMPHTDGISCAKMIRKYEQTKVCVNKGIPIMFVSANGLDDERRECLSPNGLIKASSFYKKPLSFNQMQESVKSMLSK